MKAFYLGFVPESQGQNLAVTVLYVPCSLGEVTTAQGNLAALFVQLSDLKAAEVI